MNWQKGLLRMWMVASLVWLCVISFALHSEVRKSWDRAQLLSDLDAYKPPDCVSFVLSAEAEPGYREELNMSEATIDELSAAVCERKEKLYVELKRRSKLANSALYWNLALIFAPPILVLVLGALFGWILSGFKK